MRIIRQIYRGMTTLPHVGEHPGTGMVLFLIAGTALAGFQGGGMIGLLGAATFATLLYGPMYCYGAYSRAEISDKIERMNNAVSDMGT